MKKVARINIDDYFAEGQTSILKREDDLNQLLLRLTVVVGGIQDWIDEQQQKTEKESEPTITDTIREILCRRYTVGHFVENKILVTLSPKVFRQFQKECDAKKFGTDRAVVSKFYSPEGSARILEDDCQREETRYYIPYKENKK